jgi:glycopeptide antibiotics resistance protein
MFFPSLISLFLVSQSRVVIFAGTCSLGIELAQTLFGFGFDASDLGDLIWNAVGIGLALITYHSFLKKIKIHRLAHAPQVS